MRSFHILRGFALLLGLCTLACSRARRSRKAGGATLNGTVTDATGAAVASAKVTATSPATGFSRTVQTIRSRSLHVPSNPGRGYEVAVEAPGFKRAVQQNITLSVGSVLTVDLRLEVGAATETVSVTSEAPVVETERTATATTVPTQQVRDLPVNGRNFIDFTVLTPALCVIRHEAAISPLAASGPQQLAAG